MAGLKPDGRLPPWPQTFRFRLSPPTAEIIWTERSDSYAPPSAERLAPRPEGVPMWRQGGLAQHIVDAPITLISATADALLAELARYGVDPAVHLSSDKRSST